ncbi:hypothetical protein FOCC_FOCC011033 [Frankliniella occidentalis]|nr:hypothetical protein FOCC_FOCC011033 [Frankliniella occidentalis]
MDTRYAAKAIYQGVPFVHSVDIAKVHKNERVLPIRENNHHCPTHVRMCQACEELLLLYMKDTHVHRRPLHEVDPAAAEGFIPLENLFLGRPVLSWLETPGCAAHPEHIADF